MMLYCNDQETFEVAPVQNRLRKRAPSTCRKRGIEMKSAIDLIRKCGHISASIALSETMISVAQAQTRNAKRLAEATKEAMKASDVFSAIMNVPDNASSKRLPHRLHT